METEIQRTHLGLRTQELLILSAWSIHEALHGLGRG